MIFNLNDENKLNFSLFGLADNHYDADSKIFNQLSNDIITVGKDSDVFQEKLSKLSRTSLETAKSITSSGKSALEMSSGFIAASQNATKMTTQSKAATIATKGLTVATKGLAIATNVLANIGIAVVIGFAISKITEFAQRVEEQRQSALQFIDDFNQSSAEIEDYKSKVKDLKTELDSGNLTQQEAYDKRAQLISIQTELIGKYGKEAESIDLVNGSLSQQLLLLDNITTKAASKELTLNSKAYKQANTEMNKERTYTLVGNMYGEEDDSVQKLKSLANEFSDKGVSFLQGESGVMTIVLEADAEDAENTISEFAERVRKLDISEDMSNRITSQLEYALNQNKEILDKHQALYDQSNMYKVITSEDLAKPYQEATLALNQYNEAVKNGNEQKISESLDRVQLAKESALSAAGDDIGVANFFTDLFSALETELNRYNFEVDLSANKDGFRQSLEAVLSELKDLDDLDILNIGEVDGTDKQQKAYAELKKYADEYGISVDQLIEKLVKLGLVQGSPDTAKFKAEKKALDDISASYSTLSKELNTVKNSSQDYKTISKVVNKQLYLTDSEIASLCERYPELEKNIKLTTKGWSLESGALDLVQNSVYTLQTAYVAAQNNMTEFLKQGIKVRIGNLEIELNSIQAIADAYNAMYAQKKKEQAKVQDTYKENGWTPDSWTYDTSGFTSGLTQDEENKIETGKALTDALAKSRAELNSLSGQLGSVPSEKKGSKGSSSKDKTDYWLEAYEKERATLDYQREKELITEQQFYDRLSALRVKYFVGKSKYIDKDRELDLELFALRKELNQDWLNDQQHQINLMSNRGESEQSQIAKYKAMQKQVHDLANEGRARGLNDNSEFIQELQNQWWTYSNNIATLNSEIFSKRKTQSEKYIEDRNFYNDWGADSEIKAWNRVLVWMDEYYKKGLIKAEDYATEIAEINKKIYTASKEAIEKSLNDQLDLYNDEKDARDATLSAVVSVIDKEIEALNEKKEALQKVNDEKNRELELEKLKDALDNARRNKNLRVYSEEKGFEWVYDQQAINDAQKAIDDFETEEQIREIDNQIDAWEKYKEQWTSVPDVWQKEQDRLQAAQILGSDWESEILNKRLETVETFADRYKTILQEISDLQEKLNNISNLSVSQVMNQGSSNSSGGGSKGSSGGVKVVDVADTGGKTPSGLSTGTIVNTGGGAYVITGTNKDGSYTSNKISDTKVPAYATGGVNDFTGLAQLDGTPISAETIFNAADSKKLWEFIHNSKDLTQVMANRLLYGAQNSLMNYFKPSQTESVQDHGVHIENLNIQQVSDFNDFVSKARMISKNR